MENEIINRREFIKVTTACCAVIPYMFFDPLNNIDGNSNDISTIDSEYINMNGWILLKSDLAID